MVGRSYLLFPCRATHVRLQRLFLLGVPAQEERGGVAPTSTPEPSSLEGEGSSEPLVHADERQVQLDADRSFVIYPERKHHCKSFVALKLV